MKILICCLVYGEKPFDTIRGNIMRAGYPAEYAMVNTEGIAKALNDGIDLMKEGNFDAVGFLANDIIEPARWLEKKQQALEFYPNAGVVACSIHEPVTQMINQHVIGNWLIGANAIDKIGYFNEDFHPYGPIDLDYCDRLHSSGLASYYAMNCHAHHPHSHAEGMEYGYSKAEMVQAFWGKHVENGYRYRAGLTPVYLDRHYEPTIEISEYPI
jgi:hypothetical protein